MAWVEEFGYVGLFIISFIAATIVPVSSEGAVAGAILLGLNTDLILLYATIGNCLAVLFNYFIGFFSGKKWLEKNRSSKAVYLTKKYGWLSLFLSWLPIIGDPITIIGGIFRWNIWLFITITFCLRYIRYFLIISLKDIY